MSPDGTRCADIRGRGEPPPVQSEQFCSDTGDCARPPRSPAPQLVCGNVQAVRSEGHT